MKKDVHFRLTLPETKAEIHRRWLEESYEKFQAHPGEWGKIPSRWDSPARTDGYYLHVRLEEPDDFFRSQRGMKVVNRAELGYWGQYQISTIRRRHLIRSFWSWMERQHPGIQVLVVIAALVLFELTLVFVGWMFLG
jgi:hypothetical protein